jgi:hypothetical protein
MSRVFDRLLKIVYQVRQLERENIGYLADRISTSRNERSLPTERCLDEGRDVPCIARVTGLDGRRQHGDLHITRLGAKEREPLIPDALGNRLRSCGLRRMSEIEGHGYLVVGWIVLDVSVKNRM